MPAPADAPVLVLASGQRCGSTLIQRLLTSHKGLMIWGEHGGHLSSLLEMTDILKRWEQYVAAPARAEFEQGGHASWMANVLPGRDAVIAAARAYVLTLFGKPAAAMGRPRWGFKEVRFGFEEASAFRELFPALRVIHVTRDPRDVLVSLDSWERNEAIEWPREYTQLAVDNWARVNNSFQAAGPLDWVLSVRYEDLTAHRDAFVADVARLLDTKPRRFDMSVFERRIAGAGAGDRPQLRSFEELPEDLRALLGADEVRSAADAYRYPIA